MIMVVGGLLQRLHMASCSARGEAYFVFDNPSRNAERCKAGAGSGDPAIAGLERAINDKRPDVVMHFAA